MMKHKLSPLAPLLRKQAVVEGVSDSNLKQVKYHRAGRSTIRGPIVYEPAIVIVGQGRKIGYLGGSTFTYDPENYLVVSVPLPFECSIDTEGTEPYLAISITLDLKVLAQLIGDMDQNLPVLTKVRGYFSTPMTSELEGAAVRLLQILPDPEKSRILGPQILREITYWVLCAEQGGALRSLVARHTHFSRIARSLGRIHRDYATNLDINILAEEACMSVSAFHHHFKEVTSASPLQYLKNIRLHKAQMMLVQDGLTAAAAAERVGYGSPSQFSREFKRFFGESPSKIKI